MFWLGVDPSELADLNRRVLGFGHNRWALVSMRDADFGTPGHDTIEDKIAGVLERGLEDSPRFVRLTLMTIPRVVGYVFAPVSFFLCHGKDDQIVALVAEVRNTFGEKHHYVARPRREGDELTCRIPKRFHVSPFLDDDGEYTVRLRVTETAMQIDIDLRQRGDLVFSAGMQGRARPFTTTSLLGTLARMPLFAATIMLRIHWQALVLIVARRIGAHDKPAPVDSMTIAPTHPSVWFRLRAVLVRLAHRPTTRTPLMAEGDV